MTIALVLAASFGAGGGCGGKQDPQPQGSQPHGSQSLDPQTGEWVEGGEAGEAGEAGGGEMGEAGESPAESAEAPTQGGSGGGGDSIAQQYVAAHNAFRKQHCAAPLEWSAELEKAAQAWADSLKKSGCAFEHSRTRYGENLAGGTSGALDPAASTEMWYREVDQYDFKKGGFAMDTGHFTQVVWADTRRVGCGMTTCKGMDIIVCNYDPPGNVQGAYRENVKPKGCK
ncbi:MAG TPA: CAP family protein [Kofleriaceae bacterium]|nr:CAP family protein [Kofleriaceae bacterium]